LKQLLEVATRVAYTVKDGSDSLHDHNASIDWDNIERVMLGLSNE